MKEWIKKGISIICVVVVLALSVCSFSITSYAAGDMVITDLSGYFVASYNQPTTNENQGYLNCVTEDSTNGGYRLGTYVWSVFCNGDGDDGSGTNEDCWVEISISGNKVNFNFCASDWLETPITYVLGYYDHYGKFKILKSGIATGYASYSDTWGNDILGFQYGGNVAKCSANFTSVAFTVTYAGNETDWLLQRLLNSLAGLSSIVETDNNTIISKLTSLVNSNNSIDTQLAALLEFLETDVLDELKLIEEYTHYNYLWLQNIRNLLLSFETNYFAPMTEDIDRIVELLEEYLDMQGEQDLTAPEGNEVGDVNDAEEELLQDTTEHEESLEVTVNTGFGFIMDLMETFINSHPSIFAMFVTMLTFGFVSLILGR